MTTPTKVRTSTLDRVANNSLDAIGRPPAEQEYKYMRKYMIDLVASATKVRARIGRLRRRAAELGRARRAFTAGQDSELIRPS